MKVEEGGTGLPIANCAAQRDMRSLVSHAVILSAAERSEESRSGLFRPETAGRDASSRQVGTQHDSEVATSPDAGCTLPIRAFARWLRGHHESACKDQGKGLDYES